MGATAAQALLGKDVSVTRIHGQTVESPHAPFAIATMHPSSILRAADATSRQRKMDEFINDLKRVALLAAKKQGHEPDFPREEAMGTKSSGSKVRYAVVGLGHIAQVAVLPAFKSARNSEIVALVSGDPRKRKTLGKKYRVAQVFSYEEYDQVLVSVFEQRAFLRGLHTTSLSTWGLSRS